jgi:glycosyltransferase involved in cell wall biosynthesis
MGTKVRLLYFADIRFPLERANGIQTIETCHALAARGHTVTLVVRPDANGQEGDPLAFYGLAPISTLSIRRVRRDGSPAQRRLKYLAYALSRAAVERPVDILFTRDLGVASALLWVPRALRPAVVYESHGFAPEVSKALPALLGAADEPSRAKLRRLETRERRVWRRADGYITITSGLALELASRYGTRERISVVPDGVRLAPGRHFQPPSWKPAPLVAYAGHLYPWKGADIVLEALGRLTNTRGLIIGGHPAEPDLARLRRRADELGLGWRMTFAGAVEPPRVSALLESADVLVLPNPPSPVSSRYTSPLKLFEYLAAGKPIVASDLASFREVLRHEENSILVEAGNPDALAAGIRRVLADRELAGRIARHAFEDAANYTWERRAERLEELIQKAAGRRPSPAAAGGKKREPAQRGGSTAQ